MENQCIDPKYCCPGNWNKKFSIKGLKDSILIFSCSVFSMKTFFNYMDTFSVHFKNHFKNYLWKVTPSDNCP